MLLQRRRVRELREGGLRALIQDIAWRHVHKPDDGLAAALAIPIGASLCIAVLVLWIVAAPDTVFFGDEWTLLGAVALVTTTHEIVHAAGFPQTPGCRCVSFECSMSRLALRAGYDGPVPRNRLLWVLG